MFVSPASFHIDISTAHRHRSTTPILRNVETESQPCPLHTLHVHNRILSEGKSKANHNKVNSISVAFDHLNVCYILFCWDKRSISKSHKRMVVDVPQTTRVHKNPSSTTIISENHILPPPQLNSQSIFYTGVMWHVSLS